MDVMKTFDDKSIDLVVTSPPYDNLRDYKGYSFDFEGIAAELYRILKVGGVIVWVVGDATIKGSETGTSFRQALHFKDLGLNLHDTMIYDKMGCPFPDKTRYYNIFEYMFILSKGSPKTFNPIQDRKNKQAGNSLLGSTLRQKDGSLIKTSSERNGLGRVIKEFGFRFNIWQYSSGFNKHHTDQLAYTHPATFPEKLAEDHILSWSNPGDLVLDPMCGAGTTLKMAKKNQRNYIGIDMSEEYCSLSQQRLDLIQ